MAGKYPGQEIYLISDEGTTNYSTSNTYRAKNVNKRSGSYERFTAKDETVRGEAFVDRSGREGYKDVYSETTTYKYGDKNGYTEITCEKKVKHVDYNQSSSSSSNNSNNNGKRSFPNCDKYYKYDKNSRNSNYNYKRIKWSYDE